MRKGDIEGNWRQLLDLISQRLQYSGDLEQHLQIMRWFEKDRFPPGLTTEPLPAPNAPTGPLLLGFKRAPAAKRNHHAFEGGLVFHILEMWAMYCLIKMYDDFKVDPVHINDERVLKAILYHDFHKGCLTFELESEDPWKVKYHEGVDDKLMTHDLKSLTILHGHGIHLDDEQINALLWAEGGFSETKPDWRSVLGVLAYCLDELSGNVMGRLERKAYFDVSRSEVI